MSAHSKQRLDQASSFLFVPATRPDRFDKALATGADVVIFDLEDAVAIEEKIQARQNLITWLLNTPYSVSSSDSLLCVRINAQDSQWHQDDLTAFSNAEHLSAIMLPKAEASAASIALDTLPILALIETASGFADARLIANIPQVARLVFGSIDFALDVGFHPPEASPNFFNPQLMELALASRLANISPPINGVYTNTEDDHGLKIIAEEAQRAGCGGMLLIHPNQVKTIQAVFAPQPKDIAWAQSIVDAADRFGIDHTGVFMLDGKMVDAPVITRAKRILQRVC